ncbi:MAG: PIN domain-containing protein [Chloroflexota bacterium]|nr:PIN domain-containing protein [Chloroflexota bacterium]
MTQPYGIDTSVLVRLATAEPERDFQHCVDKLRSMIEQDAEIFASNQVIGEAYIVLQHHYDILPDDARSALVDVLTSGMVAPLNGQSVISALEVSGGPGVFDRLIADGYTHAGMETLTLDREMARLSRVNRL